MPGNWLRRVKGLVGDRDESGGNFGIGMNSDLNLSDRDKSPDDSPGAIRRLLGPWIVLPTKKNRLEGDPRQEPRDPPSDGQVRIV
nr:hypothetical protein [Tanacetum cinerariifolium]